MICLRFLEFSQKFKSIEEHMIFSTIWELAFLSLLKACKNANFETVENFICSLVKLNSRENPKNLRHIILRRTHYLNIFSKKQGKNNTAQKKS